MTPSFLEIWEDVLALHEALGVAAPELGSSLPPRAGAGASLKPQPLAHRAATSAEYTQTPIRKGRMRTRSGDGSSVWMICTTVLPAMSAGP